jgi:hypothetical protein
MTELLLDHLVLVDVGYRDFWNYEVFGKYPIYATELSAAVHPL